MSFLSLVELNYFKPDTHELIRGIYMMIGKTISHYRVIEKIGAGGMGVVYKESKHLIGSLRK